MRTDPRLYNLSRRPHRGGVEGLFLEPSRAFTLIELLVVAAIVGMLTAMLLPCLAKARNAARRIEEMSAGRQLMLGVQMYADDHGGAIFPGYLTDATAVDDQGQPLGFPANTRYPWRIIPYLSGSMESIYSGPNRARLSRLRTQNHASYVYAVSVFPSLGINSYFIGGNQTEFPPDSANAKFGAGTVIATMAEAGRPAELMVFISARFAAEGGEAHGYYQVTPPYLRTREWAVNYAESMPPHEWGFVAPRFNRCAVAAMLDGHAESFNLRQMQDMRHWCDRADRPDWVLAP